MDNSNNVVYFPMFNDDYELTNHYYRACWYLPNRSNHLENVYLFADLCKVVERPSYMGKSNVDTGHIIVTTDLSDYYEKIDTARVILVWKDYDEGIASIWRKRKIEVINVSTNDIESYEYGKYCSIVWKFFKTDEERTNIIQDSKIKFLQVAKRIRDNDYKTACVFGTGPSLEKSWDYNFSECMCVVCNSIVQNTELLRHIDPFFITAGDVVSHLGVSLYADKFRHDLIEYLLNSKAYYLTTAAFGYLLMEQCPEISHKIVLIEQTLEGQNKDLCEVFELPKLDSTLNIHMLPIANTFGTDIFINGCDGKIPNKDNEDFWAHAETAQYRELVKTGHLCHPTFDLHRQQKTYDRYKNSVKHSIETGERVWGKKYYTLQQSFVNGLIDKKINSRMNYVYDEDGRIIVSKLADKSDDTHDKTEAFGERIHAAHKLRVAIMSTMPAYIYSGGRYHAWIMAEALAERGHDTYFITNNKPVFYGDFESYRAHQSVKILQVVDSNSFDTAEIEEDALDYVVIVPNQDIKPYFYESCERFAVKKKARIILINFESGNWFNAYSPIKRDETYWDNWKEVARYGALILSSTQESMKWAKEYYTQYKNTFFDYWYPPINSDEADRAVVNQKGKRIVAFVRLTDKHKGGDDIIRLACEELRGYTFVFICGSGNIDIDYLAKLEENRAKYGVEYEILSGINDREKFKEIKSSTCLLFPSYFEGFGYPPIEALYCNTPCICYDLPVIHETCKDRVLYCKPGDVDELKEKLIKLVTKKEEHIDSKSFIAPIASFYERANELDKLLIKWKNMDWADQIQYKKTRRKELHNGFFGSFFAKESNELNV